MAQNWSDPALNRATAAGGDLLACLAATTASDGTVTYAPYNITARNFAAALADTMLTNWASQLPTVKPATGWWLDGGVPTYSGTLASSVDGSPVPLTASAMNTSYQLWLDSLPTSDPGDGVSVWNNTGIPTRSLSGAAT